jgi:hypothetical protein
MSASLLAQAQAAAQQYGVPVNLFEQQIGVESGYNPNAINALGDEGIAQINPATAADPGYGVSPISNPLDPSQALPFAAQYDAALYAKTGSWVNALQAYGTTAIAAGSQPTAAQQALIATAQQADAAGGSMATTDTTGTTSATGQNAFSTGGAGASAGVAGRSTSQLVQSGNNVAAAAGDAAAAVTNPIGTIASFLGLNVNFYDIGFIFIGAILVIGSLLFISKPAVQTVTTNVVKPLGKAAKAIAV